MRIRYAGNLWNVSLMDDGTLDIVISVQPVRAKKRYRNQAPHHFPEQEIRFSTEDAAEFRRSDGSMTLGGLRELGKQAVDAYEYPNEET